MANSTACGMLNSFFEMSCYELHQPACLQLALDAHDVRGFCFRSPMEKIVELPSSWKMWKKIWKEKWISWPLKRKKGQGYSLFEFDSFQFSARLYGLYFIFSFFIFIFLSRESDGGAMQYALCIGRIHIHTRLRVALVSEFSAGILLLTSSIYCLLDSTKQV